MEDWRDFKTYFIIKSDIIFQIIQFVFIPGRIFYGYENRSPLDNQCFVNYIDCRTEQEDSSAMAALLEKYTYDAQARSGWHIRKNLLERTGYDNQDILFYDCGRLTCTAGG